MYTLTWLVWHFFSDDTNECSYPILPALSSIIYSYTPSRCRWPKSMVFHVAHSDLSVDFSDWQIHVYSAKHSFTQGIDGMSTAALKLGGVEIHLTLNEPANSSLRHGISPHNLNRFIILPSQWRGSLTFVENIAQKITTNWLNFKPTSFSIVYITHLLTTTFSNFFINAFSFRIPFLFISK